MNRLLVFSCIALAPVLARAQWVQTNGPYGATVNCITGLGNKIFVGTLAGVYESTDSGSTWQKNANGIPSVEIYALTTRGSSLFAGTLGKGVYRSMDGGISWTTASNGLPKNFSVPELGSNAEAVFIPNGTSSYVSTDDGNNWELIDVNITSLSQPRCALTIDSITYFVGNWVTETTNNGLNWTVKALPPQNTQWRMTSLVNCGNILFDVNLSSNGASDGTLLESTDGGENWNGTVGLSIGSPYCLVTMGQELFAANGWAVFRSSDSGKSWENAYSGLYYSANILCLSTIGNIIFAGYRYGGIYRSLDSGRSWSSSNVGLSTVQVNALVCSNDTLLAGAATGFFISTNNGENWLSRSVGLQTPNIRAILVDERNIFLGTNGGRNTSNLFFSSNRGDSWNSDSLIQGYNFDAFIRSGSNLLAGGYPYNYISNSGIFQSTDNGTSWNGIKISADTVVTINSYTEVNQTLYAAANIGLYYSFDHGNTWAPMFYKTGPGQTYDKFAGAAVLGQMGKIAWLSARERYPYKPCSIFHTDTLGSWHLVQDTTIPKVGMVTAFASIGANLFVATDSEGVYLTTDTGTTWISENGGLGDTNVTSLAIQGDDLLAGTDSSGVWRRPLVEMIPNLNVSKRTYTLDSISVFPNPSSDRFTIYSADLNGPIQAQLVSENGNTVWQKTLNANGRSVEIDLSSVANGPYWLELLSGACVRSCKIILNR